LFDFHARTDFAQKNNKKRRNKKMDWKQKLGSRKFWAAVTAWISSLLTAFGVTENIVARVTLIVAGIGALVAYMLAEAIADKARAKANTESLQEAEQ
jgi:hypothetical protein